MTMVDAALLACLSENELRVVGGNAGGYLREGEDVVEKELAESLANFDFFTRSEVAEGIHDDLVLVKPV